MYGISSEKEKKEEKTFKPLDKYLIFLGIDYMFPNIDTTSKQFLRLADYCEEQYQKLGTVVMYCKAEDFMELIASLKLPDIGEKEVILRKTSFSASQTYKVAPKCIFKY